jgi:predicted nucleotidyltransferase component of viral defense system
MPKRTLSAANAFDLRQALHVAVLEALLASRRWEPGDLIFQGGTSLHLAHGSPRFSEDLDFLVKSTLDLRAIGASIQARLGGSPWIPKDAKLTVSQSKEGRNPHAFDVSIGSASIIGSVRVKVELWQAPASALKPLSVQVRPVRLLTGPAAGAQAFVPAAALREIYVDKIFALAARPYLKPRDVFDLHWLTTQDHAIKDPLVCGPADLQVRLATYPTQTPENWLAQATARRAELPLKLAAITRDLKRWLPATWGLQAAQVQAMVQASVLALDAGIGSMETVVSTRETPSRSKRKKGPEGSAQSKLPKRGQARSEPQQP